MKKKIKIVEENGYRYRITHVKRKEYNYIISERIAKLRHQKDTENIEVTAP